MLRHGGLLSVLRTALQTTTGSTRPFWRSSTCTARARRTFIRCTMRCVSLAPPLYDLLLHDPLSPGHSQVEVLFRSHSDLLNEFTYFLPDAQAVKDARRAGGGGGGFRGGGRGPPARGHQQAVSPVVKHKRKTAQRAEEGFKAGCECSFLCGAIRTIVLCGVLDCWTPVSNPLSPGL